MKRDEKKELLSVGNINGDSIRSSARVDIDLGVRPCADYYLPTTFQDIKIYQGQELAKICTDIIIEITIRGGLAQKSRGPQAGG